MIILNSSIDTRAATFLENKTYHLDLISQIQKITQLMKDQEQKAKDTFAQQKKLLPRERIARAIDPGSPFVELCPFAGYMQHDDKDGSQAGGGIIAGIGWVSGVRCVLIANNSAVKGGTISPAGLDKILRLQQISLENKLPLITFAESGGANLNYAAQVYVQGARAFANQARLSAQGIPQITIVHGNATAGGAYQPGLSDYTIMIKGQSQMFLAGPPLVQAATGEICKAEDLGGANLHTSLTGSGDYLVDGDSEAISLLRQLLANLQWFHDPYDLNSNQFQPPLFSTEELLGIVPKESKQPYDMREILARILDGSEFLEFKKEYDDFTVCGHGKIFGQSLGVVGNNGPITAKGAAKGAQFIESCNQSLTPLVFLHNTTGFMVGSEAEQSGIIRQGSKMIQAVANSTVPKISILVGGSYGAGNYAMCGRGFDPDFVFAWPNSKTAVMGGEQAGKVLRLITESKAQQKGEPVDEKKLSQMEQETKRMLDASSTALYGSSHLWDDGIIDPRDTRKLLGFLLSLKKHQRRLNPQPFGIGRH